MQVMIHILFTKKGGAFSETIEENQIIQISQDKFTFSSWMWTETNMFFCTNHFLLHFHINTS